jgi:hypothetical protein
MITGSNTSGRIVGITQSGDIILSDNTVKNIITKTIINN